MCHSPVASDGIASWISWWHHADSGVILVRHTVPPTQRARLPPTASARKPLCSAYTLCNLLPFRDIPKQGQKLAFLISLKLFFVPFNDVAVKFSFRWVCSCMRNLYLSPHNHKNQHRSNASVTAKPPTTSSPANSSKARSGANSRILPLLNSLHHILPQNLRHPACVLEG